MGEGLRISASGDSPTSPQGTAIPLGFYPKSAIADQSALAVIEKMKHTFQF